MRLLKLASRRMKQKILPLLFLAICGVTAWKFYESGTLKQQIADLKNDLANTKVRLVKAEAATVAVGPPTAGATPAAAAPVKEGETAAVAKKDKNPLAEMGKAFSSMMEDENMKNMIKEMSKGGLEGQYKDLFELLQLDPEKKKALMDVLSEGQAQEQAMGMKFLTMQGKSKEEKKAMLDEMEAAEKVQQDKIKAALGSDEKYKQYQTYQDSATERMQIGLLKSKFETAGEPMNEELEQKVMDALYTERKATKWEHNYFDQHDKDMAKFSDEALANYDKQAADYDAKVDQRMGSFLSEKQMEAFRSQRTQSRAMEKMGLNMGKALFGDLSE